MIEKHRKFRIIIDGAISMVVDEIDVQTTIYGFIRPPVPSELRIDVKEVD